LPLTDLDVAKKAAAVERKTLYNSMIDGMAFSVMVGFGESMVIPFALALHATDFQVGILATLPILLGAFMQLCGANLLSLTRDRKKIILPFVFLQALTWPLMVVLPLGFAAIAVWVLIAIFCVYFMFGQAVSPVWNSLMADLVQKKERGRYFGRRASLAGLIALSTTLAAGFYLNFFSKEHVIAGFAGLFITAMVFRFVSLYYLKKMHEPRYIWEEEKEQSFFFFLRNITKTNFGRFTLFMAAMNFAVFVASPFFTPYMLNTLGFGYLLFTVINATSALASIITVRRWGASLDLFGDKTVLGLASLLVCFVPLLWVISPDPGYLLAIQLLSGFAWGGFNLVTANFAYDSLEPGKIARYIAYQNILVGIMVVLGGITGSIIIEYSGVAILGSAYLFVFLVSTALRLLAISLFLPKIKEPKEAQQITERQLFFNMMTIRPLQGVIHDMVVLGHKVGGGGATNRNNKIPLKT